MVVDEAALTFPPPAPPAPTEVWHREETDWIYDACPACQSEGRILRTRYPRWSEPYDEDCGPCRHCDGTGEALMPTELVEMEDFDA